MGGGGDGEGKLEGQNRRKVGKVVKRREEGTKREKGRRRRERSGREKKGGDGKKGIRRRGGNRGRRADSLHSVPTATT